MSRKIPLTIVLFAVLILTVIWRFVGINWDNYGFSHPDELFVRDITAHIGNDEFELATVKDRCKDDPNPNGYFNTPCTTMNPNNVNEGNFSYGTLPIFIVREVAVVVANLTDNNVWREATSIHLVGRGVNIVAEVVSVVFIFLIGQRLFGRREGLFAAILYASAVLPIQLSHFWTVDIISHMWFIMALYFAVLISQTGRIWAYLAFGIMLGAAVASRANLLAGAILAPAAAIIYLNPPLPRLFRLENEERQNLLWGIGRLVGLLFLAAIATFVTFRVAQPYAFAGPGFFDVVDRVDFREPPFIHLNWNQEWRTDLKEVADFASQQTDGWPPSHQWVGRLSYLYPWFNFVYGMGIVLWITGTLALITAVFNQLRQRKLSPQVGLLTIWFLAYFGWQGQLHFMTLRYYLPLYSVFTLLAVWWVGNLPSLRWRTVWRVSLVGGTFLWALMFTAIYRSPQTRVEAAYWIRDEFPAAINMRLGDGEWQRFKISDVITQDLLTIYHPRIDNGESGILESQALALEEPIAIQHVWFRWLESIDNVNISLQLYSVPDPSTGAGEKPLAEFTAASTKSGLLRLTPDKPIYLSPGDYRWRMSVNWVGTENILHLMTGVEWTEVLTGTAVNRGIGVENRYGKVPYTWLDPKRPTLIDLQDDITIDEIFVPHQLGTQTDLVIETPTGIYVAHYMGSDSGTSLLGEGRFYRFEQPITLPRGIDNRLQAVEPTWVLGTAIATEGDWDTDTPARICWNDLGLRPGYVSWESCEYFGAFDAQWYVALPLHVVQHDDEFKVRYMQDVLLKADYLTISTNRMYDALPRNESLYWFTDTYFDELFNGDLGYREVKRFAEFPHLGPIIVPDQILPDSGWAKWVNEFEAEEAFTVYDHPTIYVFENDDFSFSRMPPFIQPIDTRNRINLDELPTPTYTLPNKMPSENAIWRTTMVWALGWLALSWLVFPLVYVLFPAIPLRGFVFGQAIAWLLLSLIPWWITAMTGLPLWRREALFIVAVLFVVLNGELLRRHRTDLGRYIRQHWKAMVAFNVMWLGAFAFGVVLRAVNPDYWNSYLGGERPMDLGYLHATLRTESFPPPNPWLSGFSINYYYLGFVIVGMPLKLFNIATEIGPNLILATLYATIFVTVFGVLWSLFYRESRSDEALKVASDQVEDIEELDEADGEAYSQTLGSRFANQFRGQTWILAAIGTAFVMLAGTYGTIQRILRPIEGMAAHRWYWYPTRIITESRVIIELGERDGLIINEFPAFSFLYGDLHAHMIGLIPVLLLLAMMWVFVKQRSWWLMPIIGALLSVLFMTNVWDVLVYAPLVVFLALFVLFTSKGQQRWTFPILMAVGALIMAFPYLRDFTTGQSGNLQRWTEQRTPLAPFLLVWGAPIAVVTIWLLHRIKVRFISYADFPVEVGMLCFLIIPVFTVEPQSQTVMLLWILCGLTLILVAFDREMRWVHLATGFFCAGLLSIEYVTVNNDRMNTGFKVSYQLWLWAGLLIPIIFYEMIRARRAYLHVGLAILFLAPTLLFAYKAIPARVEDRNSDKFSLNGYTYMDQMQYLSEFNGQETLITFEGDLDLIRYMRENITGYPVIAEVYLGAYKWNSRISTYTGLPTVIGWEGHLRQQYSHQVPIIFERTQDMFSFYLAGNVEEIQRLIRKYNIEYIVYGTVERSLFDGQQEAVFDQLVNAGMLSIEYRNESTKLYRVNF